MKTKKEQQKVEIDNQDQPYFQEWLESKVDPEIINLNVKYLEGNSPNEYLLYGLGNEERINSGVLRKNWLDRYSHLFGGGWWCSGVDITKQFADADWGCFKPNEPKLDKQKNKPIKYETPPKVPTEIFTLKVPDSIWDKISQHWEVEKDCNNFWEWVLKHHQIPLVITEGAKKAGALLTAGYAAIALPGIWNGTEKYLAFENNGKKIVEVEKNRLIEHLEAFIKPHREIIFAFDSDEKYKTQCHVKEAIIRKGELFKEKNTDVYVWEWKPEQGKGIDDFIANHGENRVHLLYAEKKRFDDYIEGKNAKVRRFKTLKHWIDYLRYEEFDQRLKFNELSLRVELDDQDQKYPDDLRAMLADQYAVEVSSLQNFTEGIAYLSHLNAYDPVRDYLNKCQQTAERVSIDNLSSRYFKTTDPVYDRAFKAILVGLVKRRFEPGCQHDYVAILQGAQGAGKSTFIKLLAAGFYSSGKQEMLKRDALMTWHSKWIHELDEFAKFSNKEINQVKSFITTTSDTFRAPWAHTPRDYPRGFGLLASVNELSFLRDHTGDRRFWIFQVPKGVRRIDLTTLATEVEGIWASAMDAYQAGSPNFLCEADEDFMTQANKKFKMEDAWLDDIAEYLGESQQEENGPVFYTREYTTVAEILDQVLKIPKADYQKHQTKVGQILLSLEYEKIGQKWEDGKRMPVRWKAPLTFQEAYPNGFKIEETKTATPPPKYSGGIAGGIAEPQPLPSNGLTDLPLKGYSGGIAEPQPSPSNGSSDSRYTPPLFFPKKIKNDQENFSEDVTQQRIFLLEVIKTEQDRLEWTDDDLKKTFKRVFPHKNGTDSLTNPQLQEFWEHLGQLKPASELKKLQQERGAMNGSS
jgi:predicted P-loop ATPase